MPPNKSWALDNSVIGQFPSLFAFPSVVTIVLFKWEITFVYCNRPTVPQTVTPDRFNKMQSERSIWELCCFLHPSPGRMMALDNENWCVDIINQTIHLWKTMRIGHGCRSKTVPCISLAFRLYQVAEMATNLSNWDCLRQSQSLQFTAVQRWSLQQQHHRSSDPGRLRRVWLEFNPRLVIDLLRDQSF